MEKFPFQDGGIMLVSPDSSTPASSSPIDLLSHLLNENNITDDDYDKSTISSTTSGDRSQRPSDEEDDNNYHLPLFKRGTVNYRNNSSSGDSGFSSSAASFSGLDFSSFRSSNASSASTDLSPPVKDYHQSPTTFDPFQPAFSSGNQNVRFNNQSLCDNLIKNNALLPFRSQQTASAFDPFDCFSASSSSSAISGSIAAIGHERSTVPKYNNQPNNYSSPPTSNFETDTQNGDLNILHQAVSLAAMSLNDKEAVDALASQQALANIAALAQIDEAQNQMQQHFQPPPPAMPAHNFGRQFSFPPEQAFHPPPMFGRAHQNPMSAYGYENSWKNELYQGGSNYNGMMGGTNNGFGPAQVGRPPLRPSVSSPAGEFGDYMQIRCKFGQLGVAPAHFNAPHGFCIGRSEEIVVADTNNHRIQVFDKLGNFRFAFGRPGKEDGCLWHPRKVAVLRHNGHFVVCDRGIEPSRMQVFNERGMFLRRVCVRFVKIVAGLATTSDGSVVIVDSVVPTIFVIDPENGKPLRYLECAEFMIEPSDIAVFKDDFYICDFKGHSVVVVNAEGQFLRKIKTDSVTRYPNGIDISDAGDILVGDSHGNQFHVAIFDRYGQFVSHFHCPQVKVSRCCGLKITSEGYIVTLAKNNHHVLVLNTLYVA